MLDLQSNISVFSLSRNRRINLKDDFDSALLSSHYSNRYLYIFVRKNNKNFARLGLIVTKKIMQNAVTRNIVKRLVREFFRCNFPKEQPYDIVVRVRRKITSKNKNEFRQALAGLFSAITL